MIHPFPSICICAVQKFPLKTLAGSQSLQEAAIDQKYVEQLRMYSAPGRGVRDSCKSRFLRAMSPATLSVSGCCCTDA